MSLERTQTQQGDEYREAQKLSLERARPPGEVPGYEAQKFLGAGAYGEVWVAIDRTTGRRVAIKFYTHRGGLDWSLLSREVEKLVFLSADRYVVQLLDVGWDAKPPYYVMEYMEHGSLDDRLAADGALPAPEAVALFRDVAVGLVHAHGKGVLHCDLKPGNVLLDQDGKPRLADFGQSRLTNEQDPALGTLFYMAPEQADLKAVPDARWDVYAQGALLYAMLTGAPPHRSFESIAEIESAKDLDERLSRYRALILESPKPSEHRRVRRVDSQLAEIIDRCLAVRPERRFANPQAVLDAIDAWAARRARRPLLVLGAVGPLLLMVVMVLAALRGLETAVRQSDQALTVRALESNRFAAQAQAEAVASELARRYRTVERLAASAEVQQLVESTSKHPDLIKLCAKLNDPALDERMLAPLREEFVQHPARAPLQQRLESLLADPRQPEVASWIVNGPVGLQLARSPSGQTIGRNYGWRNYFHGGAEDRPQDWRPPPGDHIRTTSLSQVFRSQATGRWIAGISTPIFKGESGGEFLGIIALTVEVGHFVRLEEGGDQQLAVLVDWRKGANQGQILQHPLYDRLLAEGGKINARFEAYRIPPEALPSGDRGKKTQYVDPLSVDASGAEYRGRWLAETAPVKINGRDSGLVVVVQEAYERVIGQTLGSLRWSLITIGAWAAGGAVVVVIILWAVVVRGLGQSLETRTAGANGGTSSLPPDAMATIADRRAPRGD